MNLRDLMNKLDTIAEADDPRAQYDKFKADDARTAAVAQVKKLMATPLNAIPRLGDAIDPKTGIIYYGDAGGRGGEGGEAKPYPYKWLADPASTSTQSQAMYKILTPAGLKVIPVEQKGLFGSSQVAGISLQQLADLDKPVAPPVANPAKDPAKPADTKAFDDDVRKLQDLTQQLIALMAKKGKPVKENFDIANSLLESFGYQLHEDGELAVYKPGAVFDPNSNILGPAERTPYVKNMGPADVVDATPKIKTNTGGTSAGLGQSQTDANNAKKAELINRRANGTSLASQTTGTGALAGKEAELKAAAKAEIDAGLKASKIPVVASAAEAGKIAGMASKGLKVLGKAIPGVGLVFGTQDAIARAEKGDYAGAAMAGISAVAGLVPGIGTAISLGLDAANMARDYAKTGDAFGGPPDMKKDMPMAPDSAGKPAMKPGGDPKLAQLQKIIGAKQDGFFGPETKGKLQVWQQSQGIKADGQPGPETYGKAGIKESTQTVAEDIRDMQARLALIESKAVIRESLGQEYFLDDDWLILDEHGEYVTDLLTIAVINESVAGGTVSLFEVNGAEAKTGYNLAKDAYTAGKQFVGSAFRSSRSANAGKAADKVLAKPNNLSGAQKAGLKVGGAVARNPVKTIAGATAVGAGLGYALGGSGGKPVPPVPPAPGPTPGPVPPAPDKPVTPPPTTDMDPEMQSIMDQMGRLIQAMGDSTEPGAAAEDAMKRASEVMNQARGLGSPTVSNSTIDYSQPTDNVAPTGAPSGFPAGGTTGTPDPTLKVYKEDDELSRWLRIAHGR
jgi:peptidoglycan hydrolase-like protein with peptidoglycan-binding domain